MIVGIDASRNRSGGAKGHLIGILSEADPARHGIRQVHVWTYKALRDALPERPWLVKHSPEALNRSLVRQVLWQRFELPGEARRAGCSIMLNTDAGTVGRFRPCVTMSRDMLSYEPGEMKRYGVGARFWRLLTLRFIQNSSLRSAQGVIFLTHYASEMIQHSCGQLKNIVCIPHGIGEQFRREGPLRPWPEDGGRPIECLYISPVWRFKHQWLVVDAIAALREKGLDVKVTFAGGGEADAVELLRSRMAKVDPEGRFTHHLGHVAHHSLPELIANADLYIFASSCENMPVTLLEGMAAGLPIACSNRGPMPEVIEDGAVFFDPEDPATIAAAIETMMRDGKRRRASAARARGFASKYSWKRCADETLTFLSATARAHRGAR